MKKSIEGIKEREEQNIFQYFLKSVGDEEKPADGEKLKINYAQQEP